MDNERAKAPRNLYQRNGNWYGRVQHDGRDVRHSLRTRDQAEAARRLEAMMAEARSALALSRRRRETAKLPKVVYFIGGDTGPVKIGVAVDLARRVCELQAANAYPVRLLASRPGGYLAERAYHVQFAEHRLHGEWFARSSGIMVEIERLNL